MKLTRYYPILFLTVLLYGCLEPVELPQLEGDAKLVVNSNFTNDQHFLVRVTRSKNIQDASNIIFVNNATVGIYENGELLEVLNWFPPDAVDSFPSYRSLQVKASFGVEYEIRASAPGFETVTSTGKVPFPTEISDTSLEDNGSDPSPSFVWMSLGIDDNPTEDNFYHILVYQLADELVEPAGGGSKDFETRLFGPLKMFIFDPNAPVSFFINNRGALVNDRTFNGEDKKLTFRVDFDKLRNQNDNGRIIVELRSVTEDYYDYLLSIKRQYDRSTNPLSEPAIDFTNIENGYGIFTGFSVSRDTISLR
jgi:hypothetical protein